MVSVFIYSPSGKAVVVGHADGAIIKYNFEDEGLGDSNVRMLPILWLDLNTNNMCSHHGGRLLLKSILTFSG